MTPLRDRSLLVLCTGNSARSQIAAAYLRKYAGDRFEVHSAGTEPVDEIHPMAIEVMREQGITVEGEPQDYREYLDLVPYRLIIVCDGAAKSCPAAGPGTANRLLWPFDDPAAAEGSDEEKLEKFREVRDKIDRKIREWLGTVPGGVRTETAEAD
jgi:arsenate reductase